MPSKLLTATAPDSKESQVPVQLSATEFLLFTLLVYYQCNFKECSSMINHRKYLNLGANHFSCLRILELDYLRTCTINSNASLGFYFFAIFYGRNLSMLFLASSFILLAQAMILHCIFNLFAYSQTFEITGNSFDHVILVITLQTFMRQKN